MIPVCKRLTAERAHLAAFAGVHSVMESTGFIIADGAFGVRSQWLPTRHPGSDPTSNHLLTLCPNRHIHMATSNRYCTPALSLRNKSTHEPAGCLRRPLLCNQAGAPYTMSTTSHAHYTTSRAPIIASNQWLCYILQYFLRNK